MKKYLSIAFVAIVLVCAVTSLRADEPVEGYIVTPDKVRIFYKIEGRGSETLVAVHGGPGNSLESIRADLEPLARGRRVIYYDQRGNGRSELIKDGKRLGYEHHVGDLEAVRAHFKLDRMTLLGNSWGGLLISLYAIAHPERVQRLVLHNPAPPMFGFLHDMGAEIYERMKKVYPSGKLKRYQFVTNPQNWVKAKDPIALCREFFTLLLPTYTYSGSMDIGFKGDVCSGGPEAVRYQQIVNGHVWRSLADYNLIPKLATVKAPVLIIHGASDVIPLRSSESWANGYPNARLLLIQKSGHISHVETPEIFFPAVETFLKGTFPREGSPAAADFG